MGHSLFLLGTVKGADGADVFPLFHGEIRSFHRQDGHWRHPQGRRGQQHPHKEPTHSVLHHSLERNSTRRSLLPRALLRPYQVYTHECMHTCAHAHTHTCGHTNAHHTQIHMHALTKQTHTCTHICTQHTPILHVLAQIIPVETCVSFLLTEKLAARECCRLTLCSCGSGLRPAAAPSLHLYEPSCPTIS